MRLLLARFISGAIVGYLLCAIIGLAVPPTAELDPMATDVAASALAFSFPEDGADSTRWMESTGGTSHTWLLRRAYVEGQLDFSPSSRFSEQVLKVGWPFTGVRGFVRRAGSELRTEGAWVVGVPNSDGLVRMLPLQPVWPGIVVFGLASILLAPLATRL